MPFGEQGTEIGQAALTRLDIVETIPSNNDGSDTILGENGSDIIFGGGDDTIGHTVSTVVSEIIGDTINASGTDFSGDVIVGDYGKADFNEINGEILPLFLP